MQGRDGFLTIDEAAQIAGVTHWTIRRWLGVPGKLTRYKSASRTLVSHSERLALIKPERRDTND